MGIPGSIEYRPSFMWDWRHLGVLSFRLVRDVYLLQWWIFSSFLSYLRVSLGRMGFPGGSDSKEFACSAGVPALILGSERSPGEGNGNPLQYSCLENSMDRGTWQATAHGVAKKSNTTERLTFGKIFFKRNSTFTVGWIVTELSFSLWEDLGKISQGGSIRSYIWRMIISTLDLVDRVSEKLWMEIHNIVQETVTKTIPKKKKCKKAKW